jgi:dephospho-CoA kinase
MLIGLTGTYCAGKNYIAVLLEQRGLPVLDVDKLGHAAIEQEKEAIFSRFGGDTKKADGTVDRRRLGEKTFGKAAELAALQAIIHPVANRLTEAWIAGQGGKTCVINAALLHKSSVFGQLDCIVLITAPFFTRLIRARRRDRLSWPALLRRFLSQRKFIAQYLAGNADIYRVENPGLSQKRDFFPKLEKRIDAIVSKVKLTSGVIVGE